MSLGWAPQLSMKLQTNFDKKMKINTTVGAVHNLIRMRVTHKVSDQQHLHRE
jgi:hypothetical protein